MEAFCGRLRSTRSSGRSDDGKNCRWISGSARKAAAKRTSVTAIVSHRICIAVTRRLRYHRNTRPGSGSRFVGDEARMATHSSGAKTTATNQDTINAIPTTAKSENVYSPAELLAKPIG